MNEEREERPRLKFDIADLEILMAVMGTAILIGMIVFSLGVLARIGVDGYNFARWLG